MICIIFKLRGEVPTKVQDRLLKNVAGWVRHSRAGRLHLGAASGEDRALCYVYVADDSTARTVLKRLQETNEVEYAHIPPSRHAADVSY